MPRTDPPTPTARGPRLRGAFTALVTPFTADGAVDETAFRRLVRWQLLSGIDGLVPCGTTGESPTLSTDERERLIAIAVEVARRAPPGATGSDRRRRDRHERHGRDDPGHPPRGRARRRRRARRRAVLQPARPADARGPLPGDRRRGRPADRRLQRARRGPARTSRPTRSCASPSTRGSSPSRRRRGNLEQIARICRDRPRDVAVLAGDDAWTLPVLAMGGDGVVSVASNEIPGEMVALCAAARGGDWDGARRLHERWLPLFLANFRGGPNPVPVKAALALMGLLDDRRRPRRRSCRSTSSARDRLAGILRDLGLARDRRRPDPATSAAPSPRRRVGMTPRSASGEVGAVAGRPSIGAELLDDLEAGAIRAADPDPAAARRLAGRPGGQGRDPRAASPTGRRAEWAVGPARASATARPAAPPARRPGPWRIVPGGTSVRAGAHLAPGVVVMPPSFVNVGAWVGAGHDGRLATSSSARAPRSGARVHLAAGVILGGVLEPPGARPVIVEDDAFVGAGSAAARGRARAARGGDRRRA